MHFYYLDEAGCTGSDLANTEQPIFVLGGISVRDEGWNNTQLAYAKIIGDYFDNSPPADFELHSEELLSPNGDGPFSGHLRTRRDKLAKDILGLISDRRHSVHYYAIDKNKLASTCCTVSTCYDQKTPYLIAYDYLITHIDWFLKEKLGQSARGMLIIDVKDQFRNEIETITNDRRFNKPPNQRVRWIVEFSYPVDSSKNTMIQLSDLVVFCTKKFLEIYAGYRDDYPTEAKRFYAECYSLIHDRISRKQLVKQEHRSMSGLNDFLLNIQANPNIRWKTHYPL